MSVLGYGNDLRPPCSHSYLNPIVDASRGTFPLFLFGCDEPPEVLKHLDVTTTKFPNPAPSSTTPPHVCVWRCMLICKPCFANYIQPYSKAYSCTCLSVSPHISTSVNRTCKRPHGIRLHRQPLCHTSRRRPSVQVRRAIARLVCPDNKPVLDVYGLGDLMI